MKLGTLAGMMIWMASAAAAQTGITVMLSNQAHVPAAMLTEAQRVAGRVFEDAGISVTWIDCARPEFQAGDGHCKETGDPMVLVLNILTKDRREAGSSGAMGFAFPMLGAGTHAAILFPRLKQFADSYVDIPGTAALLGYAIAHELGHLLLKNLEHGPGVMKAGWARSEYVSMCRGQMGFTPAQVSQMHSGLRTRMQTLMARN
ncbi:hypothetical protein [Paludibaculum fermentans]|uniref:Metalloprotease n=1 Tax=Paludibaculum fermentans TaxID=1473598 RepID=A0A7S7NQ97_PALFE|nr:hypothetical protein [Paludibaculum fermentans]QOY87314.1 hypothetical protein IRI77_31880 [Paludibaculum fermentans]